MHWKLKHPGCIMVRVTIAQGLLSCFLLNKLDIVCSASSIKEGTFYQDDSLQGNKTFIERTLETGASRTHYDKRYYCSQFAMLFSTQQVGHSM